MLVHLLALTTFRPLLIFWACVLGLLAGTAIALQFIGPPAAHLVYRTQAPLKIVQEEPPARAMPSTPDPPPALKMTLSAIPEPSPRLQEPAPDWPTRTLPRTDGVGRSPATAYAAAFDPAERHPRVALVIDGAGLDRALTAQADRSLPAAVDLAFSAYAPLADSSRLATEARAQGRECLVSIPMEPNGFPAAEEGDRSLLTGADPAQLRLNLEWALSGVPGCVGATGASDGMEGERFAESRQAFSDMLAAVTARGLLYFDPRPGATPNGASPDSYVADVVIDREAGPESPADAEAIDRNLAALEQVAARHGAAIGVAGPPTPVLLDRVAVWAHGLASRGLVLAPLSAIHLAHPPALAGSPRR